MKQLLPTLLLLLTLGIPGLSQVVVKYQGLATAGNIQVSSGGVGSTNKVLGSYTAATVSVYLTGTVTLATLYSDSSLTPKSNPFTVTAEGYYEFYTAPGTYDLRFSGTGVATPFTRSVVDIGLARASQVEYYALAARPTCAAALRGRIVQLTDSDRQIYTCRNTTGSTYAWVPSARVVDVANFGIVSDGTTDQTSALTTLFGGTLVNYAGIITIPYNTKFTVTTVYASFPVFARVEDESEINWGQAGSYRNRFKIFASNSTTANDAQVVIADTHHPALTLNNMRTSGSAAAIVSRASLLFASGRDGLGDPLYTSYWQSAKHQTNSKWAWSWHRYSKWNAVNGSQWAASTAYALNAYARNGSNYYRVTTGGTSASSGGPTGTGGAIADGTVVWAYQGAVVEDLLLMQMDEDGRVHFGGQADNTSNFTVSEPGTSTNMVISFTNNNSSSQILENRTAENGGGTPTTIQQVTNGSGLTLLKNATTATEIFEYSTSSFYSYVPFRGASTVQADTGLISGLVTNGGSNLFTLQGYSNNTANGSYGRMLFGANTNSTANARRFLVTNALDNTTFAIIRSADANTTPTLNSAGAVSSGTADFKIDYTGATTIAGATTISGAATLSSTLAVGSNVTVTSGDIAAATAGKSLQVKTGANACAGVGTLVTGTVTISTTCTPDVNGGTGLILLTPFGTSTGAVRVSTVTAATSFVITSSDAASTDKVQWFIVKTN